MTYPFETDAKFKALSPAAQAIVRQRFDKMSPEAKAIVASKLASTPPPTASQTPSHPIAGMVQQGLNATVPMAGPTMEGIMASPEAQRRLAVSTGAGAAQMVSAPVPMPGSSIAASAAGGAVAGAAFDAMQNPVMRNAAINAPLNALTNPAQLTQDVVAAGRQVNPKAAAKAAGEDALMGAGQAVAGNVAGYAAGKVAQGVGKAVELAKRLKDAFTGPSAAEAKTTVEQMVRRFEENYTGITARDAKLRADEMRTRFTPSLTGKAKKVADQAITDAKNEVMAIRRQLQDLNKQTGTPSPSVQKQLEEAKARLQPLQDEIDRLHGKLSQLPAEARAKIQQLKTLAKTAGDRMGEAERKAGISLQSNPKFEKFVRNPQKVAQLSKRVGRIAEKGADYIDQNLSPQRTQLYRKLAQESSGNISDLGNAQLQKGREAMAQSLERRIPGLKTERSAFQQAKEALEAVPSETKTAAASIKRQLSKLEEIVGKETSKVTASAKEAQLNAKLDFAGKKRAMSKDLSSKLFKAQDHLETVKRDLRDLVQQAKDADGAELLRIHKEARELVEEGLRQDAQKKLELVRLHQEGDKLIAAGADRDRIKTAVLRAVAAAGGVGAIGSLGLKLFNQ